MFYFIFPNHILSSLWLLIEDSTDLEHGHQCRSFYGPALPRDTRQENRPSYPQDESWVSAAVPTKPGLSSKKINKRWAGQWPGLLALFIGQLEGLRHLSNSTREDKRPSWKTREKPCLIEKKTLEFRVCCGGLAYIQTLLALSWEPGGFHPKCRGSQRLTKSLTQTPTNSMPDCNEIVSAHLSASSLWKTPSCRVSTN